MYGTVNETRCGGKSPRERHAVTQSWTWRRGDARPAGRRGLRLAGGGHAPVPVSVASPRASHRLRCVVGGRCDARRVDYDFLI